MNTKHDFTGDQEIRSGAFEDELTHKIIGAAIEVHRCLGPGLLESVYELALVHELTSRAILVHRQVEVPVTYKGVVLGQPLRIDLLVEDSVVVEIKSVDVILPVHSAQVITYLRLADKPTGLLINFNSTSLRGSVKRLYQKSAVLPS